MKIKITKAHGTGNSFAIIYTNSNHSIITNPNFIKKVCSKKDGFNTDGMLLISDHKNFDYQLDYCNNDGTWETFCANGARCAALFMYANKFCSDSINFLAGDGEHTATIKNSNHITLSMRTPFFKSQKIISNGCTGYFIDSGAKHFATEVDTINKDTCYEIGSKIRFDKQFPDGINVNFVQVLSQNSISVCTYEKGIENIVLSCGSGSVAAAFYMHSTKKIVSPLSVDVEGGTLLLSFNSSWSKVDLTGPAILLNSQQFSV
jgi:diaminopimelate epimerase